MSLFEDRLLDLAGISAILVGLYPMYECNDCETTVTTVHSVFSVIFFLSIFAFCISKTILLGRDLENQDNTTRKESINFILIYRICSGIMIGSTILLLLFKKVLPEDIYLVFCNDWKGTFWFEAIGVWTFSAFWYIRTREINRKISFIPFLTKQEYK